MDDSRKSAKRLPRWSSLDQFVAVSRQYRSRIAPHQLGSSKNIIHYLLSIVFVNFGTQSTQFNDQRSIEAIIADASKRHDKCYSLMTR